jgi:hypothetical protein
MVHMWTGCAIVCLLLLVRCIHEAVEPGHDLAPMSPVTLSAVCISVQVFSICCVTALLVFCFWRRSLRRSQPLRLQQGASNGTVAGGITLPTLESRDGTARADVRRLEPPPGDLQENISLPSSLPSVRSAISTSTSTSTSVHSESKEPGLDRPDARYMQGQPINPMHSESDYSHSQATAFAPDDELETDESTHVHYSYFARSLSSIFGIQVDQDHNAADEARESAAAGRSTSRIARRCTKGSIRQVSMTSSNIFVLLPMLVFFAVLNCLPPLILSSPFAALLLHSVTWRGLELLTAACLLWTETTLADLTDDEDLRSSVLGSVSCSGPNIYFLVKNRPSTHPARPSTTTRAIASSNSSRTKTSARRPHVAMNAAAVESLCLGELSLLNSDDESTYSTRMDMLRLKFGILNRDIEGSHGTSHHPLGASNLKPTTFDACGSIGRFKHQRTRSESGLGRSGRERANSNPPISNIPKAPAPTSSHHHQVRRVNHIVHNSSSSGSWLQEWSLGNANKTV